MRKINQQQIWYAKEADFSRLQDAARHDTIFTNDTVPNTPSGITSFVYFN